MENLVHDCEERAAEKLATPEQPYHYVNSGLPNVYLSGITYRVCESCKAQEADIPSLNSLLGAIARALVDKQSFLTGSEVRFLRKRLGKRSIDFAEMISVEPQRLSAIEAGTERAVARGRDKLIRLVYSHLSNDKKLRKDIEGEREFERWITFVAGSGGTEQIVATWLANHKWKVEAVPKVA